MAVAMLTFKLSEVGILAGKEGMRIGCVIVSRTDIDIPLPSLPMTITPLLLSGIAFVWYIL
jgi:hypothetical protein